ncbi:DUF4309 domain-containing protein [Paenibacillus filicis]|uniref:DUF4309 domain-containing protein n=1 Tax=Paenibacillus gyeongsangnamensis TaxID=3388067 RepID=A0ABT4QBY0_9BACL|nr:DUF4309 domain-containing protein [Paenibacillus filicis]MCZ8514376.1 DUF4309 domain-containing protein [Paenibacillus filicis]
MRTKKAFIGFLSAAILMIFAAGCQSKPAAQTDLHKEPVQEPAVTILTQAPEMPKETVLDPSVPAPAVPQTADNNKLATASSDSKNASPEDGSGKSVQNKPKIDIKSPYTEAKPTLLGLSLKTDAAEIRSKFGKPKDQFTMDEDADPLTVYDYGDFLVGFNTKNQLQFIDVRSPDLDPGLGGLKLGDPAGEVSKALGKPDSNTTLVMTYKASGAVLKLDIDPKTQKVNSIKLFAE